MIPIKQRKPAQLRMDEFNPYRAFKSFWQIPKSIAANAELSLGAKLLYGVLIGMAGSYGTAFPQKQTIQSHLGNPSLKTLYRWQTELVDAGLIRVHQKGRGLPNNYYFLVSSLIGNGDPIFEPQGSFRSSHYGPDKIITLMDDEEDPGLDQGYLELVDEWFQKGRVGSLPVPTSGTFVNGAPRMYEELFRIIDLGSVKNLLIRLSPHTDEVRKKVTNGVTPDFFKNICAEFVVEVHPVLRELRDDDEKIKEAYVQSNEFQSFLVRFAKWCYIRRRNNNPMPVPPGMEDVAEKQRRIAYSNALTLWHAGGATDPMPRPYWKYDSKAVQAFEEARRRELEDERLSIKTPQ